MLRLAFISTSVIAALTSGSICAESSLKILLVVGSGGEAEYTETFRENAELWRDAAGRGGAEFVAIGLDELGSTDDATRLRQELSEVTTPALWVVLIGHGSYDGRVAKFNLRGPDLTDLEIADMLAPYPGELTLINTASASGSFIRKLGGPNRVVITATKNEAELFYARFGSFFATAIAGKAEADLDQDEQVSLLESFLYASAEVIRFYEEEGRIATEHALIDDNGDALGSRSEWFTGLIATQTPAPDAAPDGERAAQMVLVPNEFERRLSPEQRSQRDRWEREVKELRRKKDELEEAEYYKQIEALLLNLARLYREVESS
jgi:hypothetical protein